MKRHNKFKKFLVRQITTALSLGLLLAPACSRAQSVRQWKQDLGGSQLAHSWSSDHFPGNSTLKVLNLCHNGRYSFYKEGSLYFPGQYWDPYNNRITGRWDIQKQGNQIMLVFATDKGEKGAVPIYLEDDGRVNIDRTSFAVKRGGAEC